MHRSIAARADTSRRIIDQTQYRGAGNLASVTVGQACSVRDRLTNQGRVCVDCTGDDQVVLEAVGRGRARARYQAVVGIPSEVEIGNRVLAALNCDGGSRGTGVTDLSDTYAPVYLAVGGELHLVVAASRATHQQGEVREIAEYQTRSRGWNRC